MSKQKGRVIVAVGLQFGSEAKGTVLGHLSNEIEDEHVVVRTGAINAGHTVPYKGGFYAMQQLPVGWVNPKAQMIVGRGAYIDFNVLMEERKRIQEATGVDPVSRILIDARAGVHKSAHMKAEEDNHLHEKIGSTAHGCMEAIQDRMHREDTYQLAGPYGSLIRGMEDFAYGDTVEYLNDAIDDGKTVIIEGTQGAELDLIHGSYPYVTSRSTGAAQWLVESGISPSLDVEVLGVIRTYPIRVAGNSGPMGQEISWCEIARRIKKSWDQICEDRCIVSEETLTKFEECEIKACGEFGIPRPPHTLTDEERKKFATELTKVGRRTLEIIESLHGKETLDEIKSFFEITTVTKKLRRVADIDWDTLKATAHRERPTQLAITFLNYVFPEVINVKTHQELCRLSRWSEIRTYLNKFEEATGAFVKYVGVSRDTVIDITHN